MLSIYTKIMSFDSAVVSYIKMNYPVKKWITDVQYDTPVLHGFYWVYDYIGDKYISRENSNENSNENSIYIFIHNNIEKFINLIFALNTIVRHDEYLLSCEITNYISKFFTPTAGTDNPICILNIKEIFTSINMNITSEEYDKQKLRYFFRDNLLNLIDKYMYENEKQEYIDVVLSIYESYDHIKSI